MRYYLKRSILFLCGLILCFIICLIKVEVLTNAQGLVFPTRRFVGGVDESTSDKSNALSVWDTSGPSDRIVTQIKYIPKGLTDEDPMKTIYVNGGLRGFGVKPGEKEFYSQNCSVKNCLFAQSISTAIEADAILFKEYVDFWHLTNPRNPDQVWIFYSLESPYSFHGFDEPPSVFNRLEKVAMKQSINWTATYRRDSTIVAPYAKWVPFDPPVKSPFWGRNFAEGKTKQVAWFVSNCDAKNNRLEYAQELSKYIEVDIIGACGEDKCKKHDGRCWQKLNKDYKFYLSFENSNCRDYITEKFFQNGLGYDVIPIVMGAHPDDYRQVAPPHSYISVEDFADPKSLGEYLNKLDNSNKLYNAYFYWKGTGRFINTKFWCRLCALLNDKNKPNKVVPNMEEWMNGKGICQTKPWTSKRKV